MNKKAVNDVDTRADDEERILQLADEYLTTLDDPDRIYSNGTQFAGMIKYISIYHFKHNRPDYNDVEQLDRIWSIYTGLCYRYGKTPSLMEYGVFTRIGSTLLNRWQKGEQRGYEYYTMAGEKIDHLPGWLLAHPGMEYKKIPTDKYSDMIRNWVAETEADLVRGAADHNRVGAIFLLKSKYGYQETAPAPLPTGPDHMLSASELPRLGASQPATALPTA